ncbi:MAG: hypothetical protein R6V19_13950, partial [Armatimonadota bacterium]
ITDLVKDGCNELEISIETRADDEGLLEAVWLTGDFGVAGEPGSIRQLVSPPQSVWPLDLPSSGLPYFAGTLALERQIMLPPRATHLAVDAGKGGFFDCAEVFLKEHSLGVRCWPPYRWRLPEEPAADGNVTIRLEITTSAGPAIEGRIFDTNAGRYFEL